MNTVFIHNAETVRVISGAQEFICTPAEFAALEPAYAGAAPLYWSEGLKIPKDAPDCSAYCAKVPQYLANRPGIPIFVTLSKDKLNADDAADSIIFSASLGSPPLPIDHAWIIRLRDEDGLVVDAFPVEFQGGLVSKIYTYHTGLEFGVVRIDDGDFEAVEVGGVQYQPYLAEPVQFTIYRELAS